MKATRGRSEAGPYENSRREIARAMALFSVQEKELHLIAKLTSDPARAMKMKTPEKAEKLIASGVVRGGPAVTAAQSKPARPGRHLHAAVPDGPTVHAPRSLPPQTAPVVGSRAHDSGHPSLDSMTAL